MSRGAIFRKFVTENMTIYKDYHGSILSWWLRFCVRSARFASVNAGNHTEGQDFDREAFNRRQKRLVAAIIGSSVGLIGSSYCLYQKLSKAKADSPHPSIDDVGMNSIDKTNDEHEEQSDVEADGRKKKGKKGFRERRVRKKLYFFLHLLCFLVFAAHTWRKGRGGYHRIISVSEHTAAELSSLKVSKA